MNDVDALEAVKKDIKLIRRSGKSAEILGWVLIVFAAVVIWFLGTNSRVLIVYGAFLVAGLYFIYSGKYIKDGRGRRTKIALLANAIIALPLCAGVLPIYVCVQSMNNYQRFRDLPENIQGLYSKPKPFKVDKKVSILLGLILVASLVSFGLRLEHLHKAANRSVLSTNQGPVKDKLSAYDFTITFPSNPVATDFSEQVSGHPVTYTTYQSTTNRGTQVYDVYAYNWPSQYFNLGELSQASTVASINSSLSSIMQGLRGTVVSTDQSTYLGHIAEDVQFTSPTFNKTITGYARVFLIGNYEYAIISLGSTQSSFNSFASSFEYNGISS